MANTTLLYATVQHIRTHLDTWSQIDYRRGATGCFAYHASMLAGAQLALPASTVERPSGGTPWPNHDAHLACNQAARDLGFTQEGKIHIADFARRALNLDEQSASALFDACNTLGDIERLVDTFASGPGVRGAVPDRRDDGSGSRQPDGRRAYGENLPEGPGWRETR